MSCSEVFGKFSAIFSKDVMKSCFLLAWYSPNSRMFFHFSFLMRKANLILTSNAKLFSCFRMRDFRKGLE